MLKRLRNRKGEVLFVTLCTIGALWGGIIINHITSGQAKKNGKAIWCRMQGIGDACDRYR